MADVTNGIFSNHCYNEMWNLFKTPEDEVGSKFSGDRRGRSVTDCITYVKKVLIYVHNKIDRANTAERIKKISVPMGKMLALLLVNEIGWKAHYWNPDVRNPRKGDSEHAASYRDMVLAKKSYYDIPISGTIIDYNKEIKSSKTVWAPQPVPTGSTVIPVIPLPYPVSISSDNLAIIEKLSQVKFAYGISRGGEHTWLFSFGEIFEVYWKEEGAKLYGKKLFKDYEWFSGAIMVPPGSSFTLDKI